jgi:hypothetical protein
MFRHMFEHKCSLLVPRFPELSVNVEDDDNCMAEFGYVVGANGQVRYAS